MFLLFAAPLAAMLYKTSLHRPGDVFSLMMMLFEAFWMIGWSVGVIILGLITVLFLFYRESARIERGRLVHVPRIGPLKIVCEYELGKITNLRLESAKDGKLRRIRFEYAGGRARLGDAMPPEAAEAAIAAIRRAAPDPEKIVAPGESERSAEDPLEAERLSPPRAEPHPPAVEAPIALTSPTTLALIAANLLPLAGVLLFGWDLTHVVVLYWAESAVIGFYTVLSLCVVAKLGALVVAPFFVAHFGAFMAGHFAFIYALFIHGFEKPLATTGALAELAAIFDPLGFALLALFVSHGVSFAVNFIGRREYQGETVSTLMSAPYRRIIVMHLAIILGAWLVMALGTPAPVLALLVVIKIALDVRGHRKAHVRAAGGDNRSP